MDNMDEVNSILKLCLDKLSEKNYQEKLNLIKKTINLSKKKEEEFSRLELSYFDKIHFIKEVLKKSTTEKEYDLFINVLKEEYINTDIISRLPNYFINRIRKETNPNIENEDNEDNEIPRPPTPPVMFMETRDGLLENLDLNLKFPSESVSDEVIQNLLIIRLLSEKFNETSVTENEKLHIILLADFLFDEIELFFENNYFNKMTRERVFFYLISFYESIISERYGYFRRARSFLRVFPTFKFDMEFVDKTKGYQTTEKDYIQRKLDYFKKLRTDFSKIKKNLELVDKAGVDQSRYLRFMDRTILQGIVGQMNKKSDSVKINVNSNSDILKASVSTLNDSEIIHHFRNFLFSPATKLDKIRKIAKALDYNGPLTPIYGENNIRHRLHRTFLTKNNLVSKKQLPEQSRKLIRSYIAGKTRKKYRIIKKQENIFSES